MVIGLGVIGCGRAATQLHLPALSKVKGLRVSAIADLEADVLNDVAQRFGIEGRYLDYHDLLADPEVGAVVVCVPPALHRDIVLDALWHEKHVLVEKPLALELADCDQLVREARAVALTTAVGFHLRHHQMLIQARKWIEDGRLGTVEVIRSVFTSGGKWRADSNPWRKQRSTGGGVLIETGVHHYDLWRYLTGSEVEQVQVQGQGHEPLDLTAVVSGRLRNGALVTATFCQGTADDHRFEIYCSAGRLDVSAYSLDGLHFFPARRKGFAKLSSGVMEAPTRVRRGAKGLRLGSYYANAYVGQWCAFRRAVESGTGHRPNFADGREATRIALAACSSARSGVTVSIADVLDSAVLTES